MNKKVILVRPSGEKEEKDVICHFKSISDNRPNIKNVSVLVVDKKENNNGNQVLEFYWEKDGMYQAILDDAAWSEVKGVIIDIIKSNITEKDIIVLQSQGQVSELTTAVGGKDLALNSVQISGLTNNFQKMAMEFNQNTSMDSSTPVENVVEEAIPPITNEPEVITPLEPEAPFVPAFENIEPVQTVMEAPQEVVTPVVAESAPSIVDVPVANETPISFDPIVPEVPNFEPIDPVQDIANVPAPSNDMPVGQVEIVPNQSKISDYDVLSDKIIAINKKFDEEIKSLNHKRMEEIQSVLNENREKMVETETRIEDLKTKAEEHLKNAQAAEQIATIAHQNAQSIQNTPIDFPVNNMESNSIVA